MNKTKIAFIDTETANTIDCPLMYNIACVVCDLQGNTYGKLSFCIDEIFNGETDLMNTCYYAKKVPQYRAQIASGEVKLVSLAYAVNAIKKLCEEQGVTKWCAHNARFDYCSMNTTQRYVTKSKYRYFLPYGLEAWDTMKMAQDVIVKMPTYRKFCEANGYVCKNGQLRKTAEILYRFITKDNEFTEKHKAYEDVMIEIEIMKYCNKQHKKMRRKLWND